MSLSLGVVVTCLWALLATTMCATPPNIVFFLADDLGWDDVSFHGSAQIPTPNIDALAASGIILNSHYAAPECTPSRASLMTGRYQSNTGLQHYVIKSGEATALPIEFTIMPQHLKKLGYHTHMVGKWHLGFHEKKYTPPFRGFDTFFGYWNGAIDYYDYTNYESPATIPGKKAIWGSDLHNGTETIRNFRGPYAQDLFADTAADLIRQHNVSEPLFLYMSNLAVHTGNSYEPVQGTPERVAKFKHIKDPKRRMLAGVVAALDDTLGKLINALDAKNMLDNTIIVFSSDNGGIGAGTMGGQGSNYPLRGMKLYTWEGGIRASAVLWSPLLKLKEPRVSMQMMHICDWMPTLYSSAGGNVSDLGKIDGMDMWKTLVEDLPSPRNETVLHIDPLFQMYSLRQGDYKLVQGNYPGKEGTWFGPPGSVISVPSMDGWVWSNGSIVKDIFQRRGWWIINEPDTWRKNAVVRCGHEPQPIGGNGGCNPNKAPCLYNIAKDPCEYHNLACKQRKLLRQMMKRMSEYNATSMYPLSKDIDPRADPRCFGFVYTPWLDPEYASDCPYVS